MKKGVLLVVLLFSFSIVAAGVVMHNADNIFLKVNGETQNLTKVVNNWITGQIITGVIESDLEFGHSSDNIIVDFHGAEENLTYVLQNLSDSCVQGETTACDYRVCNSGDACEGGLCQQTYSGLGCTACPNGVDTAIHGDDFCLMPSGCAYWSGSTRCSRGSRSTNTQFDFTCVY